MAKAKVTDHFDLYFENDFALRAGYRVPVRHA